LPYSTGLVYTTSLVYNRLEFNSSQCAEKVSNLNADSNFPAPSAPVDNLREFQIFNFADMCITDGISCVVILAQLNDTFGVFRPGKIREQGGVCVEPLLWIGDHPRLHRLGWNGARRYKSCGCGFLCL